MFFMANQAQAQLYWSHIPSHLSDRVGYGFYADTANAFKEITRGSKGLWDLLIIDEPRWEVNKETIEEFIGENPGMTVAILFNPDSEFPLKLPFKNVVLIKVHENDDGIVMLQRVLDISRTSRAE